MTTVFYYPLETPPSTDVQGIFGDGASIQALTGGQPGTALLGSLSGIWQFGPIDADGTNAPVWLNGAPEPNGFHGHQLFLAHGGQVYLRGVSNRYLWNDTTQTWAVG